MTNYNFLDEQLALIIAATEAPAEHRDEFLKHEPLKTEPELFAEELKQIFSEVEEPEQATKPRTEPQQATQQIELQQENTSNFLFDIEAAAQNFKLTVPQRNQEPLPQIGYLTYSLSDVSYEDKNKIDWQCISYHREQSDVEQLVRYLQTGYCFNSIFKTTKTTASSKTDKNWHGTQCVVFDIDNVFVDVSFEQFLHYASMKPTFAYTTRNNGKPKNKDPKPHSRFRFVYVFDTIIKNKAKYQQLYNIIDDTLPHQFYDTTVKKDNCARSPVQNISGNSKDAKWHVDATKVYRVKDFVDVIEATTPDPQVTEPKQPKRYKNKYGVDDEFLEDLYHMDPTTFLGRYFEFFGAPIMHTPLHYTDGYALTDENFRELKPRYYNRQIVKWEDGEGRRPKMFIFSKLRIQMKPDITLEELIYNLVFDRLNFFENKDKVLTNETLIRIAYNALQSNYEIKPSDMRRPTFKIDKTFCVEHGISANSYKNTVKKILNFNSISTWYDPAKSVMENLKFAEEHEIKNAKQRTLYNYCKECGINPKGTKHRDAARAANGTKHQTASMELKESAESARESRRIMRVNKAKLLAFIDFHKRQNYSKYHVISEQEAMRKTIRDTLVNIDFTEYREKCKLYNTVICTNKKRISYSYVY